MTPNTTFTPETVARDTPQTIAGEVLRSSLPKNTARGILTELGCAPSDGPPEIEVYTTLRRQAKNLYNKVRDKNETIMGMLDANIAAKQEEIATTEEFFEARDALLDAYENALKGFLTDVDETSFAIFNIRSLQQRHEGEAETLTEGIENKETNIRDLHEQRVELESEKDRKIAAIGSLAWQIEEQSPVESEPSATEATSAENSALVPAGPQYVKRNLTTEEQAQHLELNAELTDTLRRIDRVEAAITNAIRDKVALSHELSAVKNSIFELEKCVTLHKTTVRENMASIAKQLADISAFINKDTVAYHLEKKTDLDAIVHNTNVAKNMPRQEVSYITRFLQDPVHAATLARRKERILSASAGSKFKASIPPLTALPQPDADFTDYRNEYIKTIYSGQRLIADILPVQRNAYKNLKRAALQALVSEKATLVTEKQMVFEEISGRLVLAGQAHDSSKMNAIDFDNLDLYKASVTASIAALHDERAQCGELLEKEAEKYTEELGLLTQLHNTIKQLERAKETIEETARTIAGSNQEKEQQGIENGDREAIDRYLLRQEGQYHYEPDPSEASPHEYHNLGPRYQEILDQLEESKESRDMIRSAHLETTTRKSGHEETLAAKTKEIMDKNQASIDHIEREQQAIASRHEDAELTMAEVEKWLIDISRRYKLAPETEGTAKKAGHTGTTKSVDNSKESKVYKQELGDSPVVPVKLHQVLARSIVESVQNTIRRKINN